jgi:hypothetical protein
MMLREDVDLLDMFGDTYREYAAVSITSLLTVTFLWWHEVAPWVKATLGLS